MLKTAIAPPRSPSGPRFPRPRRRTSRCSRTPPPAGAYTRLDVRVPNERDDASTTKVEVQFPDGFAAASYEPVPGWTVKVAKKTLDTPIQTDDGEITEGVEHDHLDGRQSEATRSRPARSRTSASRSRSPARPATS